MAKRMFTAAERFNIQRQQVSIPTGAIVTIAGFEFNLVPLTSDQLDRVFGLMDVVANIQDAGARGANEAVSATLIATLIAREGKSVKSLIRDVLLESAKATDLIDFDGEGIAVFDEWFARLDLLNAVRELIPAIMQANGLTSVFGKNPLTPPSAASGPLQSVAPAENATPSSTSSTSA